MNFFKWRFLFEIAMGVVYLTGCHELKIDEKEARKYAQQRFEKDCEMINQRADKFVGPQFTGTSKGNTGEIWYQYVWENKLSNTEIIVGVSESGEIAGGTGPIERRQP